MSTDKYPSIFSREMATIVYISIIQLMKVLHPRLAFHPLYLICSLQFSLALGPLSCSPQLSLFLGPLSCSPQPSLFPVPLSWILGLLSWVFDLQPSVLLASWLSVLDTGSSILGPWSAALSPPCFLSLCPGSCLLYLGSLVSSPQSSLLLGPLSWILGPQSWVLDLQPSATLVSWPSVLDPRSPILDPWSAALSHPCFLAFCPGSWVPNLGSLICSPQSSLLLGLLSWILGPLSWVLNPQPSVVPASWPSVLDPGSPILDPWSAALSRPCFLAFCPGSWVPYLGSLICSPQSSLLLGLLSWILGPLSWVLDLQPSVVLVSWPSVLNPGSMVLCSTSLATCLQANI